MQLIEFTEKGLYVPQADVYIDPWKKVDKAFITHGHSDHARSGSKSYIATHSALPVIKHRLGSHINAKGINYGEEINVNGVKFSFHPAGHIIGSAQIRVEYKGEVWVASGDYKIEPDGVSEDFESVKCHAYITESTFGLPVFKWKPQAEIMNQINSWWQANKEEGRVSILAAYSLGKAQRIINNVDHSIGKVFTHGAVENVNEVIRRQGKALKETTRVVHGQKPSLYDGSLIIAPPSAVDSAWSQKFKDFSTGVASGWMATRGTSRRRIADRGFVLSDHADWDGLLTAIKASEAEKVYVTHGYTEVFSKYLKSIGYYSAVVNTEYKGDDLQLNATEEKQASE
jgi:putative mRNA 3-end processing factor